MGFFKDRNKPKEVQQVKIVFGQNYIQSCQQIMQSVQNGTWNGGNQISISFEDELLGEIDNCVASHQSSGRVLYSDDMQFLDVVGESFHQEELRDLYNQVQDSWLPGFLMPEPLNPHDPNAVGVMIITPDTDEEQKFNVVQAGHLKKEQAKKVSKKIINLMENDAYIPILLKLSGGPLDKPSLGVIARAKTDKIKF